MSSMVDRWQRGYVDMSKEHFVLLVGSSQNYAQSEGTRVASIGFPDAGCVNVSLFIEESDANERLIQEIEREINFFFLELHESDPWGYAQYHCGTASNAYGAVQWGYFKAQRNAPKKDDDNSNDVKQATPTELELDHFFWNAIQGDLVFRSWFLQRTKFSALLLDLVVDEKWHHRWYRDPESGKDSETDILLIFQNQESPDRYAIHIENKPAHGKWRPGQPENYKTRAGNRMIKWRYVDFQTALVAPSEFIELHAEKVKHFDILISYEDISSFVPQFGLTRI